MTSRSDIAILAPGKLPGPMLGRLIDTYRTMPDPAVRVTAGYGRDAAVIDVASGPLIVKSDPITFATANAARYLVAVNVNDIACLGGVPRWMTVVALLPENKTTEDLVEQLFADLQQACDALGIAILGGHTEVTLGIDRPLLIGTILGTVGPHGILEPGKGAVGDDIWLTRTAAIEGTALLASECRDELVPAIGADAVDRAMALLVRPGISIAADAIALQGVPGITALHDPTEGGVATAVHELAEASSLGAEIHTDRIPLLPETRGIADHFDLDPFGMLSSGSLLIAAHPSARPDLVRVATEHDIPVTRLGSLTSSASGIMEIVDDDQRCPLPRYDRDEITRVL